MMQTASRDDDEANRPTPPPVSRFSRFAPVSLAVLLCPRPTYVSLGMGQN